MKKTFSFVVSNKKPERQCDSIKYEVKKYIARERRKNFQTVLTTGILTVKSVSMQKLLKTFMSVKSTRKFQKYLIAAMKSFYLEVMVKPKNRMLKSDLGTVEDLD